MKRRDFLTKLFGITALAALPASLVSATFNDIQVSGTDQEPEPYAGTSTFKINYEKCNGCGECFKHDAMNILGRTDDGKPYFKYGGGTGNFGSDMYGYLDKLAEACPRGAITEEG